MLIVKIEERYNQFRLKATVTTTQDAWGMYWLAKRYAAPVEEGRPGRKIEITIVDEWGVFRDPRKGVKMPPLKKGESIYLFGEEEIDDKTFYSE